MTLHISLATNAPQMQRIANFYRSRPESDTLLTPREWSIDRWPDDGCPLDGAVFMAERDGTVVAASALRTIEGRGGYTWDEMFGTLVAEPYRELRPFSLHALFVFARTLYADLINNSIPFSAPIVGPQSTRLIRLGLQREAEDDIRRSILERNGDFERNAPRTYLFADQRFIKSAQNTLRDLFDGGSIIESPDFDILVDLPFLSHADEGYL